MHTPSALLDVHARAQRNFAGLIAHCSTLAPGDWDRPLDGFGYETIRLQLHHAIGAQRYWLGVLEGRMDLDGDEADFPTVEAMEAFRARTASAVDAYLARVPEEDLYARRECTVYGGKQRMLVPAHVLLRTITHLYHHIGQVAAMCRLVGKPIPGFDFPLD